jgi:hypothetical protein
VEVGVLTRKFEQSFPVKRRLAFKVLKTTLKIAKELIKFLAPL